MKLKNKMIKAVSLALGTMMVFGASNALLVGCKKKKKQDTLVVMTDALNGLFNPFFYTAGTDGDVTGMTQISMFSTDDDGEVAFGDKEAVVVKDFEKRYDSANDQTEYLFVIKNGITFSDGKPLTMNDIMFNLYVYLDPAYTGMSTMYSTDIVGLQRYRTQQNVSGDGSTEDEKLTATANARAQDRINELINLFRRVGRTPTGSYEADEATMTEAIEKSNPSVGYTSAIGETDPEKARKQLLEDYKLTLEKFKAELKRDYDGAKDSYTDEPYKSTGEFDEITSFMYAEGFVKLEYARGADGKFDKSKIEKVERNYSTSVVKDEESAIKYVYDSTVSSKLDQILTYWGTATELASEYVSKAKDVILHEQLGGSGLIYKNIEGIKSLGHEENASGNVTVGGTSYKLATEHNADGTVKNNDEYDILSIKINKIDPKAIWNFGFTVAPYHYYSDPETYPVDIKNNQFGVDWAKFDFMKGVIQGSNKNGDSKNKVPVGAGPYVASDEKYSDSPKENSFYHNKAVYYKANESFILGAPKIKKLCYQEVSSNNALGVLKSGSVHYIEPQYTKENKQELDDLKSKGYNSLNSWQLGYGYIGINAGKVENIYLRRAIMAAMDTKLVLDYYSDQTAVNIAWPMSVVSWAYPRTAGNSYDGKNPTANMEVSNDFSDGKHVSHDYTRFTNEDDAKAKIKKYMGLAGVGEGSSQLTIKFTIAGSNLTEHPTYATFSKAAKILNECGWNVDVVPDTNALIKLSSGALTVWAAAWGGGIDPDMYQIYHKNSSTTNVLAWGYREILTRTATYPEENRILTEMSKLIDNGRKTDDQGKRAEIYKNAMGYVLDLAVEMPCYQRQVLYAYNANVINKDSMPEKVNPFTSPLSKIWEIELVN